MSTNATIAINRKDGTRTAIYLHYDGYIEGAGTTLQLAFNTADKVEELLKLGDLSVLNYDLEPTEEHDFENPQRGVCIAYHRDRGEPFRQSDGVNEFNYTFDETEACWFVEKEVFERDTEACGILELRYVLSYPRTLLLDEILKCEYKYWEADKFVKDGTEVHAACKEKALEARQEIIAHDRAEYEAYYRAYCD